jgi:hypothetical protein
MRMRALNPEQGTPDRCRRSNRALLRLRRRRPQEKRRTADPGGQWRRPARAHADRRGPAIQPCSSHSWMACASLSAAIAHPRSVRIAGRRSSSSISEIAPAKRILLSFIRSGPLSQGMDCGLRGRLLFSLVPWLLLGEGKFEVSRGLASPTRRLFADRS